MLHNSSTNCSLCKPASRCLVSSPRSGKQTGMQLNFEHWVVSTEYWIVSTEHLKLSQMACLLLPSMIPPENTKVKMAITPTVEETMGSRPTAEQPLNSALDAMLVRNKMSQYVQNLQE